MKLKMILIFVIFLFSLIFLYPEFAGSQGEKELIKEQIIRTQATDLYIDSQGTKTLVVGSTNYLNSSGQYEPYNWEKDTNLYFNTSTGSLNIEWKGKKVELSVYLQDKNTNATFYLSNLSSMSPTLSNKLSFNTIIAKDKTFMMYNHTLKEYSDGLSISLAPKLFGYKISSNVPCHTEGNELVCDEQRLSFDDAINKQNFSVSLTKDYIEITGKNLSKIDPLLSVSTSITMSGFNDSYDAIEINSTGVINVLEYNGTVIKGACNETVESGCLSLVVQTFLIRSGGLLNGTGKGFRGGAPATSGEGPGGGIGYGGGGGGYGGRGGNGSSGGASSFGGPAYGNATGETNNVTAKGSGGSGGDSYNGGSGGGYIKINASNLINITGNINSVGANSKAAAGGDAGGGSGGGVWLITNNLYGSATVNSNGGQGNYGTYPGGGGAGGRIYIQYCSNISNSITYSVTGGTGYRAGGTGTINQTFTSGLCDSSPPIVSLITPTNYTNQSSTSVTFNCSGTDDYTLDTFQLYENSTGTWIANQTKQIGGTSNSTTFTIANFPNGYYKWSCVVNDSLNKIVWATENRTFRIDSLSPTITLSRPDNNLFSSTSLTTFEINTTDLSNLQNVSLITNWTGSWVVNETYNTNSTSNSSQFNVRVPDGKYSWSAYACDSLTNCGYATTNQTLTIDTTNPNLNVTTPLNRTYNTAQTDLKYTINDANPGFVWYKIDSGSSNYITWGNNVSGLGANQGSNNWTVYANDSFNHLNISSVIFFLDSVLPILAIVNPNADDLWLNYNTLEINYTLNELNKNTCTYNDNGAGNIVITCGNNVTGVTWSQGQHNVSINVTDIGLNNASALRRFYIDSINPNLNITYPLNKTYNYTVVKVNNTIGDANINSCWSQLNSGARVYHTCGNNLTIVSIEGNNNITLWVNDSANNINSSQVLYFISSPPNIQSFNSYPSPNAYNNDSINRSVRCDSLTETNLEINISTYKNNAIQFSTNYSAVNGTVIQSILDKANTTKGENWGSNFSCWDGNSWSSINNSQVAIINYPVKIVSLPDNTTIEDATWSGNLTNLSSYTYDADGFGEVSYSILNGNLSLIICSINGQYVNCSTPASNQSGTSDIEINATDGTVTSKDNFTITITALNDNPYWIPFTITTLEDSGLNSTYNLTDYAKDVETASTSLIFTIVEENLSRVNCGINADTDHLDFTPYSNYSGNANCTIRADDGTATTDFGLNFTITNVNDIPYITDTNLYPVPIYTTNNLNYSAKCLDVDNNDIEVNITYLVNDIIVNSTNITTTNGTVVSLALLNSNYVYNDVVNATVRCWDGLSYSTVKSTSTTILDNSNPTISLITPVNYYNSSLTSVTFNCSGTDNTNISSFMLYGSWSGWGLKQTILNGGTSNSTTFTETISDGLYNWTCRVNDTANNYVLNETNRTIRIDSLAPVFNITKPINGTYLNHNTSININYTRSDAGIGIDTCAYDIDGGAKVYIPCSNFTINVSNENMHTINLSINDSLNNQNSSIISFYADSIYPVMNITMILTITGSNTIRFNHTIADAYINSCKYTVYNWSGGIEGIYENISIACGSNNTAPTVSAYSTYTLRMYGEDLASNENYTEQNFTTVASTPPGGGGGPPLIISVVPTQGEGYPCTSNLNCTVGLVCYPEINGTCIKPAICSDRICDSPRETPSNCPEDCSILSNPIAILIESPVLRYLFYGFTIAGAYLLTRKKEKKQKKDKEERYTKYRGKG